MSIATRPHTKLAAALLAAGFVATAPAVVASGHETMHVLSNTAVRPVSVVTDLLYDAGDVVNSVTNAALIATDAVLGLNFYLDDSDFGWGVPFNPVFAALTALQDPSEIGGVLSYVAQLYLNPSYNYPNYTYAWYLNGLVLEPLAGVLPSPLNSVLADAINGVADGINSLFSNLPDPTAAVDSMWNLYNTVPGRLLYAAQFAISLPAQLAADVAYWAAYLPADVEASVESAVQHPADIPGLLSNLVYEALDPNLGSGMLGGIAYTLAKPFFYLPAPIGESGFNTQDGLAYGVYQDFVNAVSGLLSLLPSPITPTPFAAAATPSAAALVADADAAPSANGDRVAVKEAAPSHANAESPRRAASGDSADAAAAKSWRRKAASAASDKAGSSNSPQGQRHSQRDSGSSASRTAKAHGAA